MACRTIAIDPSIVRRPTTRRRPRPPLPPSRQVKLLEQLVRWLLSSQVPVDFAAQIGCAA